MVKELILLILVLEVLHLLLSNNSIISALLFCITAILWISTFISIYLYYIPSLSLSLSLFIAFYGTYQYTIKKNINHSPVSVGLSKEAMKIVLMLSIAQTFH